jgi:putative transposase
MPRRQRITPGGFVYHVVNRAAGRLILFENDIDYMAFESLVSQSQQRHPIKIIAYCLMVNHWHLLLWPDTDGAIRNFIHWLCTEHARRWRKAHDTVGRGAVYQGRYRANAIQNGRHLFAVWRYIERNPLRAGLVEKAEAWPWSSLAAPSLPKKHPQLAAPPLVKPDDWVRLVNEPQTVAELRDVRATLREGAPYGETHWMQQITDHLGWRARGRPGKKGPYPFYR